jgi:5-methylcytosine-specific restriction endonuclease McrA
MVEKVLMTMKKREIRAKVNLQYQWARFTVETLRTRGLPASLNWGYARLGTALTGQPMGPAGALIAMKEFYVKHCKNNGFFFSKAWLELRYEAILLHGRKCQCCGSLGPLHIDHIKPRSKFPKLALDINNLQVLCRDCNLGKGTWDQTDWRV